MSEPSLKAQAWGLFDAIVAAAAPDGNHSNPWFRDEAGALRYRPDFGVLARLLGVPLRLGAASQTGVPALALDVWLSYELRRSGFDPDGVWPRPTPPRVLPGPVAALLHKLPRQDRDRLWARLVKKSPPAGVVASSASILGKNYLKQVDVVMSNWVTGPELLISTKRMDSSFGKNAANRVEESYGDAKNLRLRHPLAALGFVYGLRSTVFEQEPETAEWLVDLLHKLGREDDAYHAVGLIVMEYEPGLAPATADDPGDGKDPLVGAGVRPGHEDLPLASAGESVGTGDLPEVVIRHDQVPEGLQPGHFLAEMVRRVLDATPVNMHREARARRALV